jgi:predicted Zn finger-like uncharacterized protein
VILACPACRTRFLVDEHELDRPAGRTLRCANCGHAWHRPPPLETRDREPAAPSAALRIEPELGVPPRPGLSPVPTLQQGPRRRRAVGWVVLSVMLALLALAILAAIIARNEVAAMWPAAARLYGFAGFSPRLELGNVVPARTAYSLVIEGDVTNSGSLASDVPRLRVALRDPAEKETQFKIIDPPTARLGQGETAHFKTSFDHPDEAATGVLVTFAAR